MRPKIGDEVSIQHETKQNKSGEAFVSGAASFGKSRITAVYHSGRVRVTSGDVWRVVPLGAGKWRTSPEN